MYNSSFVHEKVCESAFATDDLVTTMLEAVLPETYADEDVIVDQDIRGGAASNLLNDFMQVKPQKAGLVGRDPYAQVYPSGWGDSTRFQITPYPDLQKMPIPAKLVRPATSELTTRSGTPESQRDKDGSDSGKDVASLLRSPPGLEEYNTQQGSAESQALPLYVLLNGSHLPVGPVTTESSRAMFARQDLVPPLSPNSFTKNQNQNSRLMEGCYSTTPAALVSAVPPPLPSIPTTLSTECTLVVRHLPKCIQSQLMLCWNPRVNCIDFLYLPYCEKRRHHVSYCFVNFYKVEAATAFRDAWHNKFLPLPGCHEKALSIDIAEVQGFKSNVLHAAERVRNSRIKGRRPPAIYDRFGKPRSFSDVVGVANQHWQAREEPPMSL